MPTHIFFHCDLVIKIQPMSTVPIGLHVHIFILCDDLVIKLQFGLPNACTIYDSDRSPSYIHIL